VPDELEFTRLPAPSRQKAMDWSLVLASQDIPHLIASPDEAGNWSLQVARADTGRASQVIRLYESENRPRPWQHAYFEGRVVFDWTALIWAAALVIIHGLTEKQPSITDAGIMHGVAVSTGDWWRLLTATQLHADWGHLASNLSIGVVLLGLVMGRWGTAVGMLAALLAGAGGNVADWLLRPECRSLGASSVVMGTIGLLALTPRHPGSGSKKYWRGILGGIAAATMLFTLNGLNPHSDVIAHAGGFITGLALAVMLRALPPFVRGKKGSRAAALLLAVLLAVSWLTALTSPARNTQRSPVPALS
jgi:membrane associated rhomboid family serine protease